MTACSHGHARDGGGACEHPGRGAGEGVGHGFGWELLRVCPWGASGASGTGNAEPRLHKPPRLAGRLGGAKVSARGLSPLA
jgi:hypothetical protein